VYELVDAHSRRAESTRRLADRSSSAGRWSAIDAFAPSRIHDDHRRL
jgi:hypothetical protein